VSAVLARVLSATAIATDDHGVRSLTIAAIETAAPLLVTIPSTAGDNMIIEIALSTVAIAVISVGLALGSDVGTLGQ
jgi:hypothetical protein